MPETVPVARPNVVAQQIRGVRQGENNDGKHSGPDEQFRVVHGRKFPEDKGAQFRGAEGFRISRQSEKRENGSHAGHLQDPLQQNNEQQENGLGQTVRSGQEPQFAQNSARPG